MRAIFCLAQEGETRFGCSVPGAKRDTRVVGRTPFASLALAQRTGSESRDSGNRSGCLGEILQDVGLKWCCLGAGGQCGTLTRRAPDPFEPGYRQGWGNTLGTWKISCPGKWCLNTSARVGWDVSPEGLVGSTEESGVEEGEQRPCLSPREPREHAEQGSKRLRF